MLGGWWAHDLGIKILVLAMPMLIAIVASVYGFHHSHRYDMLFHLYQLTVILCDSVKDQPEEKKQNMIC